MEAINKISTEQQLELAKNIAEQLKGIYLNQATSILSDAKMFLSEMAVVCEFKSQ